MAKKEKKSFSYYIRALHRDIGFFAIGLIVIYTLSGISLIYRDTSFLTYEKNDEKKLSANLSVDDLGEALHLEDLKVTKVEGDVQYFKAGTYNKATGLAQYTKKSVIFPFNKFIELHKTSTKGKVHLFATIFAGLLFFLAVSSFWMFKPGSALFRRGLYIAVAGVVFSLILLFAK